MKTYITPLDALDVQFLLALALHACFCLAFPNKAYFEYHDSQRLAGKWERTIFALDGEQEVNKFIFNLFTIFS